MGVEEKPDIIDITEKKRLQWYGHVKRMQEERLPKLIMEWIQRERRKRGRPKERGWKAYEQPWKQHI
jgi:IS5 family transposase